VISATTLPEGTTATMCGVVCLPYPATVAAGHVLGHDADDVRRAGATCQRRGAACDRQRAG